MRPLIHMPTLAQRFGLLDIAAARSADFSHVFSVDAAVVWGMGVFLWSKSNSTLFRFSARPFTSLELAAAQRNRDTSKPTYSTDFLEMLGFLFLLRSFHSRIRHSSIAVIMDSQNAAHAIENIHVPNKDLMYLALVIRAELFHLDV
eukprot:gb/GEZN01011274.1/.p3 GENE.gb/GEZN01011274.1/~~gb/GEZN01011274.1/.p3  ORF type:complete len:146 (-),score=16.20 gb/GEZN01011274.1/:177-614(-)